MKINIKKITKRIVAALSLTLAVSALTGCAGGASGASSVNMAFMTTGFVVPLHAAYIDGSFEKAGVNISDELFFDNGPSINEAIASGDIQVAGIGAMPSITGAIANGTKIVSWLSYDESSVQIYARNDSDIVLAGKGAIADYPDVYGTADTWRGKSVICAKGTSSHYTLLTTLKLLGLTESDIELINMEGVAGASAFASGTGDIFVGFDPQWAAFYTDPDNYTCISTCEAAGGHLYDLLIATDDYCENHGDDLVKIIEVILEKQALYATDKDTYYADMYAWQNTYGECSQDLATYSAQIKPMVSPEEIYSIFDDGSGNSDIKNTLTSIADFMVDNSVIEQSARDQFVNGDYIDTSFLKQAIDNLNSK